MTHTNNPTNEEELRYKITMSVYPSCRIIETTGGSMGSSLFTVDEDEVNTLADAIMQLITQYGNTRERQGELYQLKMLQHWQNLHSRSIEPEDLQHAIKSLEQLPEQPLARETLDRLSKLQDKQEEL